MGFIKTITSCMIVAEFTSEYTLMLCAIRFGSWTNQVFWTVLGLLSLKKAYIASPLFVPLLVSTATLILVSKTYAANVIPVSHKMGKHLWQFFQIISILFSGYIRQEHFHTAEFLPIRSCLRTDSKDLDLDFLEGSYLQPELKADRQVWPDSMSDADKKALEEFESQSEEKEVDVR